MNISRVYLSSPKLKKKKMQFQQNVQNFYRAKTQKYKSITWDPKKLTGT